MTLFHASSGTPGGSAAPARRLSRGERLGAWIECVLDFGDTLDVGEIHPLFNESARAGMRSSAPRSRLRTVLQALR